MSNRWVKSSKNSITSIARNSQTFNLSQTKHSSRQSWNTTRPKRSSLRICSKSNNCRQNKIWLRKLKAEESRCLRSKILPNLKQLNLRNLMLILSSSTSRPVHLSSTVYTSMPSTWDWNRKSKRVQLVMCQSYCLRRPSRIKMNGIKRSSKNVLCTVF